MHFSNPPKVISKLAFFYFLHTDVLSAGKQRKKGGWRNIEIKLTVVVIPQKYITQPTPMPKSGT